MMRKAVILAALVALAGCGAHRTPAFLTNAVGPETDAVRMREAAGLPSPYVVDAQAYLAQAAMADLYEAEAGRVVAARTANRHVRQYAERSTQRHEEFQARFADAAARANATMPPPAPLDAQHAEMVRQLQTAADVDRSYLAQQRYAHVRARTLHAGYAAHGEAGWLRGAARGARTLSNRHLGQLDRLERRVIAP